MQVGIAAAILWVLATTMSFGQTFYGSVVGTVTNSSGSAVPQANVAYRKLGRPVEADRELKLFQELRTKTQ